MTAAFTEYKSEAKSSQLRTYPSEENACRKLSAVYRVNPGLPDEGAFKSLSPAESADA